MAVSNDKDEDGPALRLHRLVELTQIRVSPGNGQRPWQSWRAYLETLPESGDGSSIEDPLNVLASALQGEPSPTQLATISSLLDAPLRYFDMTRPRHKAERDLLIAQLQKVGAGGARICRDRPTGFELVQALEFVLDIACRFDAPPRGTVS